MCLLNKLYGKIPTVICYLNILFLSFKKIVTIDEKWTLYIECKQTEQTTTNCTKSQSSFKDDFVYMVGLLRSAFGKLNNGLGQNY